MPDTNDPKKRLHVNDPLHGVTVKAMLTLLVEELGWEEMAERARMNCFYENPSMNSSLKFLRKTPWAREAGGAALSSDCGAESTVCATWSGGGRE